ncbi:hypothetical protein H8356DRAFT_1362228 [Neocallimastix lanati (nom. inval.)]|nr:hypothetical protein H8356DRAFT_1362228 [Neocallimastix sp. JGI-2020a]
MCIVSASLTNADHMDAYILDKGEKIDDPTFLIYTLFSKFHFNTYLGSFLISAVINHFQFIIVNISSKSLESFSKLSQEQQQD